MKIRLVISGMTCQNCVTHVRKALESLEGAKDVHVDLARGEATVEGVDGQLAIAAIQEEGYQASIE